MMQSAPPHLRQLRQANFLASYTITEAARGNGFILNFRRGSAFIADYDRFYRGRHQGDVRFEFRTERQDVAEPLKVACVTPRSGTHHLS
jgi:hypothetical protein